MRKIAKTEEQLVNDLREQTSLLEDALQKVSSGDLKYSKTISGILRILIIETRTNKPLLFVLAQRHRFKPRVVIDSPFGIKTKLLKEHLKDLFFSSGTQQVNIANEEFIKIASQQDGGSHIDLEVDFGYQFANEGILIGGLPPKVLKLKILGSHVLRASKELLSIIERKSKTRR